MHILFTSSMMNKTLLYLDPVSQGAILQAVLGALLAITLFVRAFWSKIKSLYNRLAGKSTNEQVTSTEDSVKK